VFIYLCLPLLWQVFFCFGMTDEVQLQAIIQQPHHRVPVVRLLFMEKRAGSSWL
jgi:hypothetical protein